MLICLRVKIGLSGFAGVVVAGALADELLVPAWKRNWISKTVIVWQHWSPHSGHWGTYKSAQVDRFKDQSIIYYLLFQRNLPAPPSCVLPPLALERKVLNPGKGGPAGRSIWNTYKIPINRFFLKTLKREKNIFVKQISNLASELAPFLQPFHLISEIVGNLLWGQHWLLEF